MDEVREALALVEKEMGKSFADPDNTLLLSVRSGAALSMPGMMDTVLNLGLNDAIVEGLAKQARARTRGTPRHARARGFCHWPCCRRQGQPRPQPRPQGPTPPR
jgi:hypothetical protein